MFYQTQDIINYRKATEGEMYIEERTQKQTSEARNVCNKDSAKSPFQRTAKTKEGKPKVKIQKPISYHLRPLTVTKRTKVYIKLPTVRDFLPYGKIWGKPYCIKFHEKTHLYLRN